MGTLGAHGVVLGASISGLAAARVLSEFYERVTVLERDVLPAGNEPRKGTPQCRHGHILLPAGGTVLDELLPGLLSDLAADGVPVASELADFRFAPLGHRLSQAPHPMRGPQYQASRPHLEHHVRRRIGALPNVEILDGTEVLGLASEGDRVTGARILRSDGEQTLTADLVVDATGRGGRTTTWLQELGYEAPVEDKVPVDIKYVSRRLRLAPGALGREMMIVIGPVPELPRAFALLVQENNWWMLTLCGYRGHHPPTDEDGILEFVRSIAPDHAYRAVRDAEKLTDPVPHRFPNSLRRRYERLHRFPAGLVAFGDAICSFNPLHGQGMTLAALQAVALRECLRKGDDDLARRFFRAAAKPIDVAWQLGIGGDLTLPEVEGQPTRRIRLLNSYVDVLLTAAEDDPVLAERFLAVSHLIDPPTALLRPDTVRRALRGVGRRPRRGAGLSDPPSRRAASRPGP